MLVTNICSFSYHVSLSSRQESSLNFLPNDKILDQSKFKALADHKLELA